MSHYLGQHPDVFMPAVKEINFFGSDLTYHLPYSVSSQEYADFFAPASGKRRVGEASVMYLYSRQAATQIHSYNPDARILIMLRNPVETMYAQHSQLVSTADEDILDFEAALAAEENRRLGLDIPQLTFIVDYLFYKKIVCFSTQVRRYFNTFGRDRVHVIIYDDFRHDTATSFRRVLKFLELDVNFSPDFAVVNANKTVRWSGLRNFVKHPPAYIRTPLIHLTPLALRRQLRTVVGKLNTREKPRKPMDGSLRQQLNEMFTPEVEDLSELLGVDLMHWIRQR